VRGDRPVFRWTPLSGARAYVVTVAREDLTQVAQSEELAATEWTPGRPLPRGTTLSWQVAALTSEGRRIAPAPPDPEARFELLEARRAEALARSLAEVGGSRLAIGYLLARAGALDEAETALAALAASNPDAEPVARLLDGLRAARRLASPRS
jgi:hypothetical protein